MKVFFSFNMKKQAVLCHTMAAYWKAKDPTAQFAGLFVAKDYDLKGWLNSQDDAKYEFLDSYEELVEEAVNGAASVAETQAWEKKLGLGLRDMIVADRQFGREYSVGGRYPQIALTKLIDHEFQQKVTCRLLAYYEKRLTEFKPDIVFLPAVAAAHAVALGHVATHFGIPTIRICPCLLPNRIQLSFGLYPSQETYASCENTELDASLEEYHDKFSGRKVPVPIWKEAYISRQQNLKKKGKFKLYWRYGRRFVKLALKTLFHTPKSAYEKLPLSEWWCKANFEIAQASAYDFGFESPRNEPFVLFPLHVDPEASTMLFAPAYTDQTAVAEALSKAIPLSHKLYVKDHQSMVGKRPRGFYDSLKKLSNVRLISPWEDTHQLMAASSLVVSITGSCCWEAANMKKSSLLLGNPLYPVGKAIKQCSDLTLLPGVIYDLISNPVEDDSIERIGTLDQWCVKGDFMSLWRETSKEKLNEICAPICVGIENMLAGLTPKGFKRG